MKKRTITLLFLLFLFFYIFGFFSKPSIEYQILVSIPRIDEEIRNIDLILPIPFYRGLPLPYYKGVPIEQIVQSFDTVARSRGSVCKLVKTKYGNMIRIKINKLKFTDDELRTDRFLFHFKDEKTGRFFTPLYFFKPPGKIFFLNPMDELWYWEEKAENSFVARRDITTNLFSEFIGDEIILGIKFRLKKRYLFGNITVQYSLKEETIRIKRQGWQKINLKVRESKKLF